MKLIDVDEPMQHLIRAAIKMVANAAISTLIRDIEKTIPCCKHVHKMLKDRNPKKYDMRMVKRSCVR